MEQNHATDAAIIDLYRQRSERAVYLTHQRYGGLCTRVAQNILENPADDKAVFPSCGLSAIIRKRPYSEVSARLMDKILTPFDFNTSKISPSRPFLFSMNTEICFVTIFLPLILRSVNP